MEQCVGVVAQGLSGEPFYDGRSFDSVDSTAETSEIN